MNPTRTTEESVPGKPRKTIVAAISGAYAGYRLLEQLTAEYDVIALSGHGSSSNNSHTAWRHCDLFSIASAEKSMQGADYALYLDPPLMPPVRLTQASFEDMNVIPAYNFACAARHKRIRQIMYVYGIIPGNLPPEQQLRHERSRLETAQILESSGVPVTIIPDGLTGISDESAAFERLVRTSLEAENAADFRSVKEHNDLPLSRVKEMALSNVRSIQRVQLPGDNNAEWAARYYIEWLGKLLKWLISIEDDSGRIYRVRMRATRLPVLELTLHPEQSSAERTVYRISGGALTQKGTEHLGRLEFLQIPGTRECIIAIHDYFPSLPWFVYQSTQAVAHLWVMAAFRRHLQRMAASAQ